ncbi:hypothetical protein [Persicobacter psychrovividus]|uniref:Uncharacterized protein n=1 Tax=Persicobacter psychrovividus TaxID=387638 RepID=A0ABN6LDV0_9BACT|nr:hypothetical protein PEPS_18470 [Persicobacter psychrovividus]
MKFLLQRSWLLLLLLVGVACSSDDDMLPESDTLKIMITNQDPVEGAAVSAGQVISISMDLTSTDRNLRSFSIKGPGITQAYEDILDTDSDDNLEGIRPGDSYDQINNKSVKYTMEYTVSNQDIEDARAGDGMLTYEFTLTDRDGETKTTASFTVPQFTFAAAETADLVYTGSSQSDGKNENEDAGIKYKNNSTTSEGDFMVFESEDMVVVDKAVYDAVTAANEDSYNAAMNAYDGGSKVSETKVEADSNFKPVYLIVKKDDNNFSVVQFTALTFSPGNNVAKIEYKLIGKM